MSASALTIPMARLEAIRALRGAFDTERADAIAAKLGLDHDDGEARLWVCPNCGSPNVEYETWFDPNGGRQTTDTGSSSPNFCNRCDDHPVTLELIRLSDGACLDGTHTSGSGISLICVGCRFGAEIARRVREGKSLERLCRKIHRTFAEEWEGDNHG